MFRVPESNRIINHPILSSTKEYGNNGLFIIESIEPNWKLACIASDQEKWEHVSVHSFNNSKKRIPNWKEMCFVKMIFWEDEDLVIQYHPKKSEYINTHEYVLHLWRPIDLIIPTPPIYMI